jgi:hypothetical protein
MRSADRNNGAAARNRPVRYLGLIAPPSELSARAALALLSSGSAAAQSPVMTRYIRRWGLLGSGMVASAVLFGCATPTSPPPAASAAPAATGKPAINGYRRQVRNGQEIYCSGDAKTGSRVKGAETCYTAMELAERQKAADEILRNARGAVGESAAPRMDSPSGPY